ncbi:MAG TPA: GWxTD domain-containing protein, partial [Gemmatimonadales bacterium]
GARILDRALDRRATPPEPLTAREVAVVYYTRGLMHQDFWRDWRSFGHLLSTAGGQLHCAKYTDQAHTSFTSGSEDNQWLIGFNTVCPTQFDSVMSAFFSSDSKLKEQEFLQMETAFDSAAAIDTSFADPLIALASEYVYGRMWEKAEPVADQVRRRFPDDYRSWALSGLVQHELRHDSLASLEFGQALIRMSDTVVASYDNIDDLLEPAQQEWFAHADPMVRSRAVGAFWNSLDPLYVTPYNERKLEHYARVASADLLFGSRTIGEIGSRSFAGKIWVRYGRPLNMRELTSSGGRVVFWNYGGDADITFIRGTTRTSYRGSDDAIAYARELSTVRPQGYQTTNFIDSVEALDHQIVRFRGADGTGQVLLYAAVPDKFSEQTKAAAVLLDAQFQAVGEWRGPRPTVGGIRRQFNGVRTGLYSLTVELWDASPRRLGRGRDTLSFRPDTTQALQLSDLLLAASIEAGPNGNTRTAGREALNIIPLYGTTLTQNNPLALYWEIYGLKLNGDRVQYSVTVQVEDAQKHPMLARLLGVTGQDKAPKITYDGNRQPANGRVAEWLAISSDLTPGPYKVLVTIEDKNARTTRTVERALTVK